MESILKAINLIRFDGISVTLTDRCLSYTDFYPGQVLEAGIYNNMIIITPALEGKDTLN